MRREKKMIRREGVWKESNTLPPEDDVVVVVVEASADVNMMLVETGSRYRWIQLNNI